MMGNKIHNEHLLKQLNSQLQKAQGEREALKSEIGSKQRELQIKESSILDLKKQICRLQSSKNPIVSEHALLRYFERVLGYDLDEIKSDILTESVRQQLDVVGGNGKFPNKDHFAVVKNYTVITVVPKKGR